LRGQRKKERRRRRNHLEFKLNYTVEQYTLLIIKIPWYIGKGENNPSNGIG
jgi:hypothetical protein